MVATLVVSTGENADVVAARRQAPTCSISLFHDLPRYGFPDLPLHLIVMGEFSSYRASFSMTCRSMQSDGAGAIRGACQRFRPPAPLVACQPAKWAPVVPPVAVSRNHHLLLCRCFH